MKTAKIKITNLLHSEMLSGFFLVLSFIAAICVANIPMFQETYRTFVFLPVSFGYGQFIYHTHLINLANDGLMALFFLLIGLELKFHLVCGEFKDKKTLVFPSAAAVGGIIIPALFYLYFNYDSSTSKGWAIPIATDTAFMLGILSFFGKFITSKLRAFIIGFSLVDDALALIILAVFFSKTPNILALISSVALISFLIILNQLKIKHNFPYILIGVFLWFSMVEAGIHGTLSGIIIALAIPVQINDRINPSFHKLESFLKPLVYFLILPLFSFINSGIDFSNFSYDILQSNITLGIISGLFLGKQLGVFLFSYAAVKMKWCSLPKDISWGKLYAVAILGGIGFTLSLFIGDLTFEAGGPNYAMRAGVVIGSLLSAAFGILILFFLAKNRKAQTV
jgi:NhaA family Na+:H+ antiporter